MLSFLHLQPTSVSTHVPLDMMARAMQEKGKERADARLGDADCRAVAFLSRALGAASVEFETEGVRRSLDIATSSKDHALWLPLHAIVRVRPENGEGWAIAITRNGTLRWARGANASVSCEPETPAADAPPGTAETLRWLAEGETGSSSLAMAHHLMGIPSEVDDPQAHPRDIADLGRCLAFIDAVPQAAGKIATMATVSPVWSELAADWDGLTVLFKGERAAGLAQRQTKDMLQAALERARPAARARP